MLSKSDKFYIEAKVKEGQDATVLAKDIKKKEKEIQEYIDSLPKATQVVHKPKPKRNDTGQRVMTQTDSEQVDEAKKRIPKTIRKDAIFIMDPDRPVR